MESVTWVLTDEGVVAEAEGDGMLATHRSLYIFRTGRAGVMMRSARKYVSSFKLPY